MSVNRVFTGRPREHRESAVLRRHERDRVALIVDELRGREMTGTAERGRVHLLRLVALDRFSQRDLLDLW